MILDIITEQSPVSIGLVVALLSLAALAWRQLSASKKNATSLTVMKDQLGDLATSLAVRDAKLETRDAKLETRLLSMEFKFDGNMKRAEFASWLREARATNPDLPELSP